MQDAFEAHEEMLRAQELEAAKQMALKYVSVRMRTKLEVAEYLQKKGCNQSQIQEVTAFLIEYHYLDDAAYCRAWIHDKIAFHPCGRKKMEAELSKKIRDRQLIAICLEELFSEEAELELALSAAKQKLRSAAGRKSISREKLARFLYTRGYGGNIISQVCKTVMNHSDTANEQMADDMFCSDEF